MGVLDWIRRSKPAEEPAKESAPPRDPIHDDDDIEAKAVAFEFPRPKRLTETGGIFPMGDIDQGTIHSDRFFKNISRVSPLDLPPERQHTSQRLSLLLWMRNPRAYRAIELVKDFAIGDGVRITAEDPAVEALLEEHWTVNQWADRMPERLREIAIFGEEVYPAFTNEETGIVRVTTMSPFNIMAVLPMKDDGAVAAWIKTKLKKRPKFVIIRPTPSGKLEGEAFYFPANRVSGQLRGKPDLLAAIDWMEGLDGFLFGLLERADLSQNIVIDIQYDGLQEKDIRTKVEGFIRQITDGGIFAHNEKVKLEIKTPNLGSADQERTVKVILKQIQAATGLAGLHFGDSEDLTRASASELSFPVAKMIQGRQIFFRGILETVFRYQIQEAKRVGRLKPEASEEFTVEMASVFLRDLTTVTQAITQLSAGLEVAVQNNWISNEQASEAFRIALQQIGKPFGPPEGGTPNMTSDEAAVGAAIDRGRARVGANGGA